MRLPAGFVFKAMSREDTSRLSENFVSTHQISGASFMADMNLLKANTNFAIVIICSIAP